MKTFNKFIFALAAIGLTMSACSEEEKYAPGEAEMDGCYGVYFPVQEKSGSNIYDPTMEKDVTITVARTVPSDDITVPFKFISETGDLFKYGDIKFEDGQTETTFKVEFPDIDEGKQYSFTISIDDPEYALTYGDGESFFDFSVMCVAVETFKGPNPDATDEGVLTEWAMDKPYNVVMKYHETAYANIRYCYLQRGDGLPDYEFYWNTKTNNLYIPNQYIFSLSDGTQAWLGAACDFYNAYNGWGMVCPGEEYFDWAPAWIAKNSFFQPYYDGNGGFYLADWFYICEGGVPTGRGWQFGGDETTADFFLASGFTRVDYTIKAAAGLTDNGVLPVVFNLGDDIASLKYAAYEGSLTIPQVEDKVYGITKGTEESTELDMETKAVGLSFEKSGVYTLVYVGFDKNGNAQGSSSLEIKYIAKGDEENHSVDITCGVGSAEKYKGANTDTSIEIYAYGSDIVDAKMMVLSALDLMTNSNEDIIKALMSQSSVDAATLEAVNGTGYAGLASKLLPGTEYYLIVYASNGYSETVSISKNGQFTTGKPLPIYQSFTYAEYNEDFIPEDQETFIKDWNLYAVDLFGETGMREYVGKATIKDSDIPDEGPDDDGLYDQYVTINGLAGPVTSIAGFDDACTFDLYGGCLYSSLTTQADESVTTADGNVTVYTLTPSGNAYSATYVSYFIPVLDGYYAFVSTPRYYEQYNFCGLGFYAGNNSFYSAYTDYLLVDPAKDDNGVAAKAEAAAGGKLDMAINNAKINGCRETLVRNIQKGVKVYNNFIQVESQREVKAAAFTSHNIERPVKNIEQVAVKLPKKDYIR